MVWNQESGSMGTGFENRYDENQYGINNPFITGNILNILPQLHFMDP